MFDAGQRCLTNAVLLFNFCGSTSFQNTTHAGVFSGGHCKLSVHICVRCSWVISDRRSYDVAHKSMCAGALCGFSLASLMIFSLVRTSRCVLFYKIAPNLTDDSEETPLVCSAPHKIWLRFKACDETLVPSVSLMLCTDTAHPELD